MSLRIALYQPDIPQNTGAILRLGACLNMPVDIVEPCGFPVSDKALRRSAMDYAELVKLVLHPSWDHFWAFQTKLERRTVLLTTKADAAYHAFRFEARDTLLLGRESAGVPQNVHNQVHARITIPMAAGARSLNVALAGAMVAGEALRQLSPGAATAHTADEDTKRA